MKVLMVSAAVLPFWKCGVASVVDELSRALRQEGHEVAFFALNILDDNDFNHEENNTKYWMNAAAVTEQCAYIPDTTPTAQRISKRFANCLIEFKPDVVHFHTPQYFSLNLIEQAKNAGLRTIVTLHDFWWICPTQFFTPQRGLKCTNACKESCLKCMRETQQTESMYEQRQNALQHIEPKVDCFVCVSSIVYDEIIKQKPYLKDKAVVIPNPISDGADQFPQLGEPIVFSFLGAEHDIKGYPEVISAFSRLDPALNWVLNIHGCAQSVNAEPHKSIAIRILSRIYRILLKVKKYCLHPVMLLKKIVAKLLRYKSKHSTKIQALPIHHYPGFTKEERLDILSHTHVVIVYSQIQESFSLVAREAMKNGCCVITAPCSGPTEIVQNGVNGFVTASSTADSLLCTVQSMLDNREQILQLRKNAFEFSANFDTPQVCIEKHLAVYSL